MKESAGTVRKKLVETGRKLAERTLVVGPGGNISARSGNTVYLKASGIAFEEATGGDYLAVNIKTGKAPGTRRPSSELNMHLACYNLRPEIGAVVHTHPSYSVAYAMLGKPLKNFTPDLVAYVRTDTANLPYVMPAGKQLAAAVGKAIKKHNAVFLRNHGLLTVGVNLTEAYYRTLLIEEAAKTIIAAKTLGKMTYFTAKQAKAIDSMDVEKYRRKLLGKMK